MRNLELIAIHIPKTAGSALINVLISVYGRRAVQIYGRDTPKTTEELDVRWIRPRTKVLIGHFTFKQISHLHEASKAPLITFLREPVSRFLSNFYHFKSGKEHFNRLERLRRFEPLLIHMLLARYRNVISRYLEGVEIDQLYFVGLSESFAEDVVTLGRSLEWPEHLNDANGVFGERIRINENELFPAKVRSTSAPTKWLIKQVNRRDLAAYQKVLTLRRAAEGPGVAHRAGSLP